MGQELAGGYLDSCCWQNATGDTTWGNANAKDRQVDSCWRDRTGLEKMHVSSVEDTIRPEIFEAPLRSAQSFWNPFKAPASDSGDHRGLCAILCQRYMLTDSYIPGLHRSWNFLPFWAGPEFMSLENHDASWYDVNTLAPYVCVPGLLLLLQTPPAVLWILSIPTHYSCTITIWPFSLWYIH